LVLDVQPDELKRVVLVLGGLRKLGARNAQLGAARDLAVEANHRPAARALRGDHRRRVAVDAQDRALREPLLVLARLLHEKRAISSVRLPHTTDADELLSHRT